MSKSITSTSSFTTIVKEFKGLFSPAKIKKATTEDLLLLKGALEMGIKTLNEQVEMLSTISIVHNNKQQKRQINNNYLQPLPVAPPEINLNSIQSITGFDAGAVGLFDAEAEARRINESYLNSISSDEVIEDEVQKLEEMFGSIENE